MLDELDRAVLHALRIDGRAPFARIAAVLDVSTQTVARRYRRMRAESALRVVGLADPDQAGRPRWLVRITTVPRAAPDLARALVRRPDTTWVKLASGGTEIVAVVEGGDDHALLLQDIPRTPAITAVSAHCLLHTYRGGPTGWHGHTAVLTAAQRAALAPDLEAPSPRGTLTADAPSPRGTVTADAPSPHGVLTADAPSPRGALTEDDADLLAALHRDGRASLADLAAATGWSPATTARRLTDLRASGALFFDVEFDNAQLGVTTQALLWLAVAPTRLDRVGSVLGTHDELAFVAATTGPTNLVAHALCESPAALHRYLTRGLGGLSAIRTLETSPVLRTVKAASPVP
ncbi:Lrp/AsnC family transcriptional regulator [Actinomadura rupiterrae]|uniref:Lrp/AsnC family transcriptional regulator n=1 Tax=Actinomadura rupiterrae TaxID=559627 RepID=UPI0020A3EF2D|nr:Lrp/AsnC family transcriptional regulator [Actinomadura rupiterrae]MCP2341538.1 DNA-binding Lrp family transcriptional regulator [Actinomadura rupiterrae]